MRDYKDRVYRFEASRRALSTRRSSQHSRNIDADFSDGFVQKAKLLGIAGCVLFLCYFYVRVQIKYEKDSVFYKISQVFSSHNEKGVHQSIAELPIVNKDPNDPTFVSTRSPIANQEKAVSVEQKIFLTRLEGKQNRVVFVPVLRVIQSNGENFYQSLLQELVQAKVSGLINAIDPGVRILEVRLENEVLIVDVNQQFEFNRYGVAGMRAQLQQILWTIFESSQSKKENIQAISFLIEGKRKTTIGSDGMPLAPFFSNRHLRRNILAKEAQKG